MIVIDTTNKLAVREFEEKKLDLDYEQRKKGYYDVNDFVIVRTTNHLNEEHVLKPISKIPFVINTNNVAHSAIHSILSNDYNVTNYSDDAEYEEFKKMTYEYSPLSSQFRSTIHFTLNGLVSSHSKGNFDNQNFIIIDKLGNHLGKDNIRTLRMEDTFVLGEFSISDEAIILIDETKYQKLIEDYPFLDTYNIVLFRGDEKLATEMLLASMNIVPEKIEEHGAEYSRRTELYKKYISNTANEYGITEEKHIYSSEYQEDDQKSLMLWQIYNTKFYNELFDHFGVSNSEKESMINFLNSSRISRFEQVKFLKDFIMKVGLENYKDFVVGYNQNITDAIIQGIYPTNEEILLEGKIELKNNKKTL